MAGMAGAGMAGNTLRRVLRPRLVVFDLDKTLWPFGVDEYFFKPPYEKTSSGEVVDSIGQKMAPFPEVTSALKKLASENIDIAAASRTTFPEGAFSLIQLFEWEKYFRNKQIYPGQKTAHFERLRQECGFSFQEMLFFDDEERNISDVGVTLGVTAILVHHTTGVTLKVVEEGLKEFAKRNAAKG